MKNMIRKIIIFIILIVLPFCLFAQTEFTSGYVTEKYKLLDQSRVGCVCLGWSKTGLIAMLTTSIPMEPVGGLHLELVIIDCVTDQVVTAFVVKDPTKDTLEPGPLRQAVEFCNVKKILPHFSLVHGFPLSYNTDTYVIRKLAPEEQDNTEKRYKLLAQSSKRYKLLDLFCVPDEIMGYFKSPFEERIAICYWVPPEDGPTGTTLGGGYYRVSGCHMKVGFRQADD
jgi:hypothetical protein